jgi:hypothetical protein
MRTHKELSQSLLSMHCIRINAGRRVWPFLPTWQSLINFLSYVPANVSIHAIHDIEIVLPNLLLV